MKANLEVLRKVLLTGVQSVLLALFPILSVFPFSCKVTAEGIQMIGGDYVSPELVSYSVNSADQITVSFSEQVEFKGFVISRLISGISDSMIHSETEELSPALLSASGVDGKIDAVLANGNNPDTRFIFKMNEEMEIGKSYELYGMVEDKIGNSLTFAIPFTGYNPRVPVMEIIEVQADAVTASKKIEKTNNINRNEYVLLDIHTDGNLCGVVICSAADGEKKQFLLPAVEVKAGEKVMAHMRKRGNGCISEIEEDLKLAGSMYASETVRDLYSENTAAVLGSKSDIILLRDSGSGHVIDAFMYRDESLEDWDGKFVEYSLLAGECGRYDSGVITNAFVSTGITSSKVFKKNSNGEWIIGEPSYGVDL